MNGKKVSLDLIKTNQKIEVKDYPYGFKLRTSLFDEVEFKPKKGYRTVKTTLNPKTGRLNAPKKSTYYPLITRYFDENGHVKLIHFSFNGRKEINKACEFITANFSNFDEKEIEYFYLTILFYIKVDVKANVTYAGCKFEDIKEFYEPSIETAVKGAKSKGKSNLFWDIYIDNEKIEAVTPKDFNPFK